MTDTKKRLQKNIRLMYLNEFFTNSYFTLLVNLLFGKEYLGLSYLAAGSLVFTNRLTSFLFDFPGGTVADRIGRKQANIIGITIQLVCFVPFLVTKSFPVLLFSMAISGIGAALSSNSIDALIYEEAKSIHAEKSYQRIVGNSVGFFYGGRFYASILGGITFAIDPRLPYGLTIAALLFALIACIRINVERRIESAEIVKYGTIVKQALRAYSSNKLLLKFIILGGLFSMWGNMLFVYYQPYFTDLHVTSSELGILYAVISLGSAGGSIIMKKLPDRLSAEKIQSIELAIVGITATLLLVLGLPVVLAVPLVLSVISGFQYPNMRIYVNKITADSFRVSVLSVASSVYDAGLVIGLAISYYMAGHFSKSRILTIIIIGSSITLIANYILLSEAKASTAKDLKLISNE